MPETNVQHQTDPQMTLTQKIRLKMRRQFNFIVGHVLLISLVCGLLCVEVQAQHSQEEDLPSPRGAFLRSMVVPGWGHHYTNSENWNRGKIHLVADAALILSYLGLNARANSLENDYYTLAQSEAGADLDNKSRAYRIAIGNYDNLQEYNDAQLQLRNWDSIYPNTAEYRWEWKDSDSRFQYQDSREKVDRNRGQLPTLLTLMVANRLISGISAFIQARNLWENAPDASFSYINTPHGQKGVVANLRFNF